LLPADAPDCCIHQGWRVLGDKSTMSEVIVCVSTFGSRRYHWAGREAALSILMHTDFDVFLAHDGTEPLRKKDRRVHSAAIADPDRQSGRARPFLRKFRALEACLGVGTHRWIVSLDADAVLVEPLNGATVERALGGRSLAMAEQTGIQGSHMGRRELQQHYLDHTVAWFEPAAESRLDPGFHFYNSGVVLATREGARDIVNWALPHLPRGSHEVGEHMIADQDYYQYWTNALHPDACILLDWRWNHCRHWDASFPQAGARIVHFSWFCRPPSLAQIAHMRLMRTGMLGLSRSMQRLGLSA
jgi:hypothetical protein